MNKGFRAIRRPFIAVAFLLTGCGGSSISGQSGVVLKGPACHILISGQSLSLGATGAPALSTTQPYGNVMLDPTDTAFLPLVEKTWETIGSAMANNLAAGVNGFTGIVSHNGLSGVSYTALDKGTVPYNEGLAQVRAAQNIAKSMSAPYRFLAVAVLHGEADIENPRYESDLIQWQSDYQNDIQAITGQNSTIPMFIYQVSSANGNATLPLSPLEQLSASEDDPGRIYLVTPLYMLSYNNMYHLTNYSYRLLGAYYGKVIQRVLFDKVSWQPLSPLDVKLSGNVITVDFNVPNPPLQFDTTWVAAHPNMGFSYTDSSANPPAISNVSIGGPTSVQITLSTTPTMPGGMLSYAYTAVPGPGQTSGRNSSTGPGGNLRDSDPAMSIYNDHLYNWCVEFNDPVLGLPTGRQAKN